MMGWSFTMGSDGVLAPTFRPGYALYDTTPVGNRMRQLKFNTYNTTLELPARDVSFHDTILALVD